MLIAIFKLLAFFNVICLQNSTVYVILYDMKGIFVCNNYYFDEGMEHCYNSLKVAFEKHGVKLDKKSTFLIHNKKTVEFHLLGLADFIIFWDKDMAVLRGLERYGFKVFNSSYAIQVADDKLLTYSAIADKNINIPYTIAAPIMYDVNLIVDNKFLDEVEKNLDYPLIVKQNIGSQGRQVYKAANRQELEKIYLYLRHIPHHYQKMMGEEGADFRVYVVGGKAIASCIRKGTDFKSNLFGGGQISLCDLPLAYKRKAEKISKILKLDFGSIDFLINNHSDPLFLEANSNSYFKGIEGLGVNIAGKIAEHILNKLS
ncbi:MAG: RimK family alpha-L-glutamate ligase [Firmicutes bacterium]|nr:RimK family alpha-L-glutamate ligase [Bacillota bacterium]